MVFVRLLAEPWATNSAGSAGSALVLLELQLRLRRRQACHRHAVWRAGDVVESAGSKETDGVGIAARLAADSDFQILVRAPASFRAQADKLADTLLIDRLERILRKDLLVDVLRQERAGIIAGVAEG